jgi:hypothetical protein
MAPVRRKAVATQPSDAALIPNSFPIDGRATLIEDPMNGMRNEAMVVTSNTNLLDIASSVFIARIIMGREEII